MVESNDESNESNNAHLSPSDKEFLIRHFHTEFQFELAKVLLERMTRKETILIPTVETRKMFLKWMTKHLLSGTLPSSTDFFKEMTAILQKAKIEQSIK